MDQSQGGGAGYHTKKGKTPKTHDTYSRAWQLDGVLEIFPKITKSVPRAYRMYPRRYDPENNSNNHDDGNEANWTMQV